MASEIRVNSLTNRSGLSTVSITDTGAVISGIVTVSDTINAQSNINVSTNLSVSGVSTLGNTVVGGATTELIVGGDARITGILTIGTSSITLDGSNNTITSSNFVGNLSGNVVTTGVSTFKSLDYAGISSTISDTAVDIFVYDTSKDSDGGAWRYKTQRTSWYNETLNTSTRGSRREFPAVAVIVATEDDVIIYDGDDPDLPMWMIFESSDTGTPYDTHYLGRGSGSSGFHPSITSVAMLNGILVVGKDGDAAGNYAEAYTEIRFISDRALHRSQTSAVDMGNAISGRNGSAGGRLDNSSYGFLVHFDLHDVAMTVLPNAPIDDATGLPIPTIAVATDGGTSIIKDDGNVVDITDTSANWNYFRNVNFTPDYKLIINGSYNGTENNILHVCDIPSADVSQNTVNNRITSLNSRYYHQDSSIPNTKVGTNFTVIPQETEKNNLVLGSQVALNFIAENPESQNGIISDSMVAYATTSYNTGWQHGDIKGAFLSDTDATNVSANNLVTNSDFASGIDGYTASTATLTHDSVNQNMDVTPTALYGGILYQVTPTNGKKYIFGADVTPSVANMDIRVQIAGVGANQPTTMIYDGTTTKRVYGTMVGDGNSKYLQIVSYSSSNYNNTFTLDNVFFSELTELDRSVNNNGLQVFGTITKSPVATGAELVAYSGWSSSNYLQQPYNSDLDFGTGDWCYMFWYNPNDAESGDIIFSRWSYNVDGNQAPRISVYFNSGNLRVDTADASAGSGYQGHFGSDGTQDSNQWHCAAILRRGSNLEIWINGINYKTSALDSNSDGSYTDTNSILEIGHSPGSGSAEAGLQLALFRISGSAPSPEQIKKIYEDEKVLFQENAACTLYGSSDAVTALAYDEVNDLLHVGTSSGRSDFNGLRRINNTTTAVTTAISAYDGLIAAQ